jgi:hypothetical protein
VKRAVVVRGRYLPVTLDVAILLSYADILLSSPTRATAIFFGNADVLACVTVVTSRWALLGVSITNTFPFSALNRDSLVSLDFGGLRSRLLVPI